ncbi:hypothetical protein HNY73_020790 [Argiope bruennichi]|uniref:Uncharacterized protein n=1 Tax=Argiope bruennichi TaxID=94029 RepID=A0A8T0E999_ARGBR|nr:hypothetical protein HNY73_020790 [Argiope bruennichi]
MATESALVLEFAYNVIKEVLNTFTWFDYRNFIRQMLQGISRNATLLLIVPIIWYKIRADFNVMRTLIVLLEMVRRSTTVIVQKSNQRARILWFSYFDRMKSLKAPVNFPMHPLRLHCGLRGACLLRA